MWHFSLLPCPPHCTMIATCPVVPVSMTSFAHALSHCCDCRQAMLSVPGLNNHRPPFWWHIVVMHPCLQHALGPCRDAGLSLCALPYVQDQREKRR